LFRDAVIKFRNAFSLTAGNVLEANPLEAHQSTVTVKVAIAIAFAKAISSYGEFQEG
jgi:hypothetical protein